MRNQYLRVLIVDNSDEDATLIINELKKDGYSPVFERTDSAVSFREALREKPWDIIFYDFEMPENNLASTLNLLRESGLDIPLIVLSASLDEHGAANCIRMGARDCLAKNNLSRLCPVATKEIKDAEVRLYQRQAQAQRENEFKEWSKHLDELKQREDDLKQTIEKLRKAIDASMQVMVAVVEDRDPFTHGHQLRSTNLAYAIAKDMGLDKNKKDGVRMAGAVYEIGKLSVPAEILSKPSKLSSVENALVKEHPRTGYEILKNVDSPWPLAEIVYQHHERMDGSGYPRHLKGDEILLESRILGVSDVVESMTSRRSYRPALGFDEALREIESHKGTLYDDTVVDSCVKVIRQGWH